MTKPRNTELPCGELNVAILGCGTVGTQVARILLDDAEALTARSGARLNLAGVALRDPHAVRDVDLPRELSTTDAEELVDSADVVVELFGGIEPARSLMLRALGEGASVVTANKALMARHGAALFAAAERNHAHLAFEAAVGGAIPIIRPLRESLAGDSITRVLGILNGTTNYILDQMDSAGAAFTDALADAQRLGYAEADPTEDIDGHDAAAKLALLASLAFHASIAFDDVRCEGVANVTAEDIAAARGAESVIKLLAVAERVGPPDGAGRAALRGAGREGAGDGDSSLSLRVQPTLLPREHPLASVRGPFNAVFVEAENAGPAHVLRRWRGRTPHGLRRHG